MYRGGATWEREFCRSNGKKRPDFSINQKVGTEMNGFVSNCMILIRLSRHSFVAAQPQNIYSITAFVHAALPHENTSLQLCRRTYIFTALSRIFQEISEKFLTFFSCCSVVVAGITNTSGYVLHIRNSAFAFEIFQNSLGTPIRWYSSTGL